MAEKRKAHTERFSPGASRARPAGAGTVTRAKRWLAAAAITLLLLIAAGFQASRAGLELEQMAALGYPGVFLIMFFSGSSILFPAPGQAAVLAAGALWNPVLVGLAAGLGNATGELTGYLVGKAGAAAMEGRRPPRWWSWFRDWLGRHGFLALLLLAMVPNPTFDAVGLLAGSVGYPPSRFWLACAIGNSIKYIGVAYIGETALWLLG